MSALNKCCRMPWWGLLVAASSLVLSVAAADGNAGQDCRQAVIDRYRQAVTLFADPAIFALTPATAVAFFSSWTTLQPETRSPYLWSFASSEPDRGLERLVVEFQPGIPGEGQEWLLLQVRAVLRTKRNAAADIYQALHQSLANRFGRPSFGHASADEAISGWSRHGLGDVVLRRGGPEAADSIVIEAAIPQGEAAS